VLAVLGEAACAGGIETEDESVSGDDDTAHRGSRIHVIEVLLKEIGGCLVTADNAPASGFGLLLDDDAAGVVDCVVDDEFSTVDVQSVSS
jgi:hypothetical protein